MFYKKRTIAETLASKYSKFVFLLVLTGLFFLSSEYFSRKITLAELYPANNFIFSLNLKIGDQNDEVIELQKFLNKNPLTQVAFAGPGSPGNETAYFGNLTKKAVIAFQELFRSDILAPNNLYSGTGFVGPSTRLKLNYFYEEQTTIPNPVNPLSQVSPNSSIQPTKEIFLYQAVPYQVSPGSIVSLKGKNIGLTNNAVNFGEVVQVSNIPSNGDSIQVAVPNSLSLGKHEIWITNSNSSSRRADVPVFIIVTNDPKPSPHIDSITPNVVKSTDQITVSGTGFTSSNNLYTALGDLKNISSNDGTIVVRAGNLPKINEAKHNVALSGKKVVMPVWFFVQNDNGVSELPGFFNLEL